MQTLLGSFSNMVLYFPLLFWAEKLLKQAYTNAHSDGHSVGKGDSLDCFLAGLIKAYEGPHWSDVPDLSCM